MPRRVSSAESALTAARWGSNRLPLLFVQQTFVKFTFRRSSEKGKPVSHHAPAPGSIWDECGEEWEVEEIWLDAWTGPKLGPRRNHTSFPSCIIHTHAHTHTHTHTPIIHTHTHTHTDTFTFLGHGEIILAGLSSIDLVGLICCLGFLSTHSAALVPTDWTLPSHDQHPTSHWLPAKCNVVRLGQ